MISKRYTDYKEVTSYDYVNKIPVDWELLPNIALFDERVVKNNVGEELLSVTIGKGIIKQKDVKIKKDSSNEDKSNYKLVECGDIAYNKMRMWQGAVGYSKFRGIVSPAYIVLKPKTKINSIFFHYLLRTDYFNNYVRRFSYGLCDDQLNLRYKDFKRMYSIVPPLPSQTKIAEYLDRKQKQAKNYIAKQHKMIELLKEQKKAIINQAVTKGLNPNVKMKDSGVEWLGEIPEHWEISKAKYMCYKIGDGIHSTPIYTDNEKYFFINGNNLENGKIIIQKKTRSVGINELKKYNISFSEDTILISINGTIGNIAFYQGEQIILGKSAAYLSFKKGINKYYFFYFLQSISVQNYFADGLFGTTISNLSLDRLRKTPMLFPDIEEQNQIVEFIESKTSIIDSAISKAEEEIKLSKEYLESLIFNVVTGQICVE